MFERELDYGKVFETLVDETAQYLTSNNLKAMVLGISGGIDSTVVAAICHEVSKRTGIPLIGRSLPIKNKDEETSAATKVGEAFCTNFKTVTLWDSYNMMLSDISYGEEGIETDDFYFGREVQVLGQTPIANGNIQARLRMIYLYNLASIHNGLVMSTDNQSEYQLGFWTLHGDVGDFNPLQGLWKTEVYKLAEHIIRKLRKRGHEMATSFASLEEILHELDPCLKQIEAVTISSRLAPTDGLGISNSDLDQIGAKSYSDVDRILKACLNPFNSKAILEPLRNVLGDEVVDKVIDRHKKSSFKRLKAPIYIPREKYESESFE